MLSCCNKYVSLQVETPGREPAHVVTPLAVAEVSARKVFTPEEYAWSRKICVEIYALEAVKNALAAYRAHIEVRSSRESTYSGAAVIPRLYSLEHRIVNPGALSEIIQALQNAGLVSENVAQAWREDRTHLDVGRSTLPFASAEAIDSASSSDITTKSTLHRQLTDLSV